MTVRSASTVRATLAKGNATFAPATCDFDPFKGPWFNSRTAAAYVPCKTVKAWYEWRKRHGIVARANGSVAKADLDRELKRTRRRRLSAASVANLAKRRIA